MLLAIALILQANPYLDEGRRLYGDMHYLEAEEQLRLAKDVPTSTLDERRAAYDLLARSLAAQGRLAETQDAYAELLTKDPSAPAPAPAAPKIQEAFRKAKERVYPPPFVQLKQAPAPIGRLELEIVDPWNQVAALEVTDVTEASAPHASTMPRDGSHASVELAPANPAERRVYVEAHAADGAVLARLGEADRPLPVEVVARMDAPKPKPPFDEHIEVPLLREHWARWHVYGAGLAHLSSTTGWGFEAGASFSPWRWASAGAAVVAGRRTGAQLSATFQTPDGTLRPFAQARLSLTPLETGLAAGGGLWGGVSLEAGPGRLLAGVVGMAYALPALGPGATFAYQPFSVMAQAGYELDLSAVSTRIP